MVQVIHYERANQNKTIGYADIRVPILKPTVMVFRKIPHMQSGDRKWFNLPTFTRVKKDGTNSYLKFAQFETEVFNSQILESLGEKVKEFCAMHGIVEVESMDFDTFPDIKNNEMPF